MAKKIGIKGVIVSNENKWIYDWLGYDATCPRDVTDVLNSVNGSEDIIIEMNSGGGSVLVAHEIYTAILSYQGNIVIHVIGLSGSAASEILTACKSLISPVGLVMIHNCATDVSGDYRDMDSAAQMLKSVNQSIRNAYKAKTGKSDEELTILMDKSTWMSAQEAVDNKFVDGIMFENSDSASNVITDIIQNQKQIALFNSSGNLSQEVIDKLRNVIKQDELRTNNQGNNKPAEQPILPTDPQACILDINNNKGGTKMTLEDFLKENPEAKNEVEALKATAKQEGVTEERSRLQGIDNIATSVPKDLLDKAKYSEVMDASTLALKVITDTAASGKNYFQNAVIDSHNSGVDGVKPTPTESVDPDDALVDVAAQAANSKRKESK